MFLMWFKKSLNWVFLPQSLFENRNERFDTRYDCPVGLSFFATETNVNAKAENPVGFDPSHIRALLFFPERG